MSAGSRTPLACIGALALSALTTACASAGGATPRPFPTTAPPRPPTGGVIVPPEVVPPGEKPSPIPVDAAGAALAGTALELLGAPYQNGGTTADGFDCSGFTQYVFAQHGLALPREVRDQFTVGQSIELEEIAPGDLLFFETAAHGASHVGIALGGDTFVHAPSSTGVVRVERYSSGYWARRLLGARRVTAN